MSARGGVADRIEKRRKLRVRKRVEQEPPAPPSGRNRTILICAALALVTLLVYYRTFHYEFIFYDDDTFVYNNPVVQAGLTGAGLAWSFGLHFANWHPLTWISYLLNVKFFGMNPGAFHVVNVLLHTASVVMLFLALYRMTGRIWRCALVAAVFGLHPLHVESVAWVAERKDVLSTFFEMVTLLFYLRYVDRPGVKRYLPVFLGFVCCVMSKPMAVTLPFVFLLLDYWPLRRVTLPLRWAGMRLPFAEKLPLFAVSAGASYLTWVAQRSYGTVASLASMPILTRIDNVAASYMIYVQQAFWPSKLGVLYPTAPVAWDIAHSAVILLFAITLAALIFARKQPSFFTGWFWYVGMLVPVIGLVQVGLQSRADRYTYLPLAGLSIAIVWAVADWFEPLPATRRACALGAAIVLLVFSIVTWRQVGFWKNSRALFEHTIAVTERNAIIRNNLGVVLARAGDNAGARFQYQEAIMIDPDYAEPQGNMGNLLLRQGQYEAAHSMLEGALRIKPNFPMAQLDIGIVDASTGNFPEALQHLNIALRLAPEDPEVHSNLCYTLEHVGELDQAIAQCREALRLRPDYPDAQFNLKTALAWKNGPGF